MEKRNNVEREYDDNPGELNKGDIVYAIRKFLNDADAYAEHDEYKQIKHVMGVFLEYIEEL
jgi:hypothetical protein